MMGKIVLAEKRRIKNQCLIPGQEKIIFVLGAQTGDTNFLQTNGVFLCWICMCIKI
jgi:hypothetical protein